MPSIAENQAQWKRYDWSQAGDEWSEVWGGTEYLWLGTVLPRIRRFVPAATVLEIAPGYGRMTQYLKDRCERLILVDLTKRCIEACRERFTDAKHLEYHVNDGKTLTMVDDASIDFAFSFDSLVHVEADVMESYVAELGRVLKPEGVAFLHHSNLGAFLDPETGEPTLGQPHWRGKTMSAELMRQYCDDAGLRCAGQEIVNWGGNELHDCISVLTRPGSPFDRAEPLIRENPGFMNEAMALGEVSRQYYGA